MSTVHPEIAVFFQYLCRKVPSAHQIELYNTGVKTLNLELNFEDQQILDWSLKHPHFLGLVDAGLALKRKNSKLKARLLLATAILECDTAHYQKFLNPKPLSFVGFKFIALGFRSVFTICWSVLLFKYKGWK